MRRLLPPGLHLPLRPLIPEMRLAPTVLLLSLAAVPAIAVVPTQEQPIAVLRALDKITARVEELEVPIGQPLTFGTVVIDVKTCRTSLPEETPEAAAFVVVSEFKPGQQEAPVFSGWMFASSPALSALQHPVYDIWLTGCKGVAPATEGATVPLPAIAK